MSDNRDWGIATEKLTELTRAGEVTWRTESLRREGENIGDVYVATYRNKTIAVYEYWRSDYGSLGWEASDSESDLIRDVAIEFVTTDGTCEWTWPQTPYRWALLDAIRYHRSRAAEFYDELFAE